MTKISEIWFLDATEVFIADLIACSTCFGHHYAHHQELNSIIQWLLPVVFRAVVFKLLVWCGAAIKTSVASSWHFIFKYWRCTVKTTSNKMYFSTSCIRNISHPKQKLKVTFCNFLTAPKNDKAWGGGGWRIQNIDTRTKSPWSTPVFHFSPSYHLATWITKARETRRGFTYDFSVTLWP